MSSFYHKGRAAYVIFMYQCHKRVRVNFAILLHTLNHSLFGVEKKNSISPKHFRLIWHRICMLTCRYSRRTLKSGSNGSAWSIMHANSSNDNFPSRLVSPARNRASRLSFNCFHSSLTASIENASTS